MKSFTLNGMVSRVFDMRCYRTMYDAMAAGETELAAMAGLMDLFDGLPLVLGDVPAEELADAMTRLLLWYTAVKSHASAPSSVVAAGKGHPVVGLYARILQIGIPPDVVDRQDPEFLYRVLTDDYAPPVTADKIDPASRAFYGL